ncbi:glyoxylase-like metal-dependent hydrolase (beta-lactamase superfamily II) [Paucibacter oligotrophus]|uniref:Glyoxylase-like metal-dependent hydrolase (Beta-lactamase superfamily II) n=1 Tax=Roseateles oligotrophus TaxID=1769250 RepID=A0A840LJC0_9BURK|nr:MBL fold metallo-hydrolase [Roseateles oligotrophus]MBB4846079.1 glyoxylase-like metal-dependent hydrolase (beta-lactamase superfamily II) [Roseateles oligotrophus]
MPTVPRWASAAAVASSVAAALLVTCSTSAFAHDTCKAPGCAAGEGYHGMPEIATIGARTGKYMDIPEAAKGPAIDAAKGYRLQQLGRGLYMVTENVYQAMFLVHDRGVILADVPPPLAAFLPQAIREVTDKPVTHIVYSHAHIDHIGAAGDFVANLAKKPVIVAHEETKAILARAKDPKRPLPTLTFRDKHILEVGGQRLQLSYHGNGHEPGNIFIHAPEQRTLMVVDLIFPGWMPWRRLALAQDVPGYFAQVERIKSLDFDWLVSGHVARVGSKADVLAQHEFLLDLKAAAGKALQTTPLAEGMDPRDKSNPWAVFDHYIDRVAAQCVNTLTPKWAPRLAAFDVYIWDQCFTMEQSLRLD